MIAKGMSFKNPVPTGWKYCGETCRISDLPGGWKSVCEFYVRNKSLFCFNFLFTKVARSFNTKLYPIHAKYSCVLSSDSVNT